MRLKDSEWQKEIKNKEDNIVATLFLAAPIFQGHQTDRFGKFSVRKAFNPLGLSWYEKFNACCFLVDKSVVLSTEK